MLSFHEMRGYFSKRKILLLLADLLMIQVCFFIAVVCFHHFKVPSGSFSETLKYFIGMPNVIITAYWLMILFVSRFFRSLFPNTLYGNVFRIFNFVSLGVLIILFVMIDTDDPATFFSSSKIVLLVYWASLIITLSFNRLIFCKFLRNRLGGQANRDVSQTVVRKKLILIILDLLLIAASYYLAFLIRFEGDIPENYLLTFKTSLSMFIIIRLSMFLYFKLYSGYYRYASINDLNQILKAVTTGSILIVLPAMFFGYGTIPRGVFVIEWLVMIILLGGSRFLIRSARELFPRIWVTGKRTFIIGAGSAGEMLLRELRKTPIGYKPVGIIDDDLARHGLRLHGVPVLGGSDDLARLVNKYKVTEAIIAIPSASGSQMRRLTQCCREANLDFKSLPPLREIIGEVQVQHVRNIKVEDLLGRETVRLDTQRLAEFVNGKHILVTGGGGSIGSEICRQVMRFKPSLLIIVDRAENRLYDILVELSSEYDNRSIRPFVADINDSRKMEEIFTDSTPDIVFHAAAYKQVPLMESFPEEAVRNNIFGTRAVAELADKYSVGSFVMISTDKAVRPTSVMGATKRIAEIYVQCFAERSKVSFITVRFGNVLGSDGSVVPIFKRQIEVGGPVTVTHPDVTRYFMTIPEASLLVMQAATIGKSGDIMVLNMGEPVRIVELAKAMISLSGATPDEDIKITFTGLRPGEKLREELFIEEEGLTNSVHEKILIARATDHNWKRITSELKRLQSAVDINNREKIKQLIKEIIPDYQSSSMEVNR